MRLHHVQVGCPPGGEESARRFYADALGLMPAQRAAGLGAGGGAVETTTRSRSSERA